MVGSPGTWPRAAGGDRAGAGGDDFPRTTPRSVFSGPGESWAVSSEDPLQLLFAGKEVQVRVVGMWAQRGQECPQGTRQEQGSQFQPPATLGIQMGAEVLS